MIFQNFLHFTGKVRIVLRYIGNNKKFPDNVMTDWSYGDDNHDNEIPVDKVKKSVQNIHAYSNASIFHVKITVYNGFDTEVFTTEVRVF